MNKAKKVVTIGGGSGQSALLSSIRDIDKFNITAIVSMADSGGSTGRLRDKLGVLPPGDILKCVLSLSPYQKIARKILLLRFKNGSHLDGHNAGNMLLTMLAQYAGNFCAGVDALGEILEIKGRILPVTTSRVTLVAELNDGSWLYGESAIDLPGKTKRAGIKNVFLITQKNKKITAYPPAVNAIMEADYILIGPGDLYTSIIPNFLVPEIKNAIKKTRARLIYLVNVMTKFGETDNFRAEDFILTIEKFVGREIDYVILNSKKPSRKILEKYKKEKAGPVVLSDEKKVSGRKIIKKNILSMAGGLARYDGKKIKKCLKKIILC